MKKLPATASYANEKLKMSMRGKQFTHAFFIEMKRLQNAQPHGFTVRFQMAFGDFSPTGSAVAVTGYFLPA
ncbi:MAG: hypothetical protein IJO02_02125, partial [Clostridia bacterium]|nr:hypothetical protein [Clostridia bacterium]